MTDELTEWARGPGIGQARRLINAKRLGWLEPSALAAHAAGLAWERTQREDLEPLRSSIAYARAMLPKAAISFANESGGRQRSGEPSDPDTSQLVGGDDVEATGSVRTTVALARRRIASWLPGAGRLGDRDGKFGDPASNATAMLYLLLFADYPLHDRFWPAGYPFDHSDLADEDLHLRVALWLADREWFPVTFDPADEATMRRRRVRAAERLKHRWAELGMTSEVSGG